jgi:hypothetical protein
MSLPITTELGSILNNNIASVIFSVLIGGGTAAIWIRKKLSADTLEVKKDSFEGNLLDHLEHERDVLKADNERILQRLIAVDKEKNEAVSKVAALTVEVELLRDRIKGLEELVVKLGDKLELATDRMHQFAIDNAMLNAINSTKDL